jgi:LPXTG-motif cell wall-anchored protein
VRATNQYVSHHWTQTLYELITSVFGALVGLGLIILLIWLYFRRKKNKAAAELEKVQAETKGIASAKRDEDTIKQRERAEAMELAYIQEQAARHTLLGLSKPKT